MGGEKRSRRLLALIPRRWRRKRTGEDVASGDEAPPAASPRKQRSPVYLAALLGVFCLVGAALLASGYQATEAVISDRHKEDLLTSLSLVIPAALHDNDLVADSKALSFADAASRTIYPARRNGQVTGLAFEVSGQGYGGTIRILIGLDRDGTILGVSVLEHSETPGLGDRIDAAKSNWITGFAGTSLASVTESGWAVKKDGGRFDQFSGATITPRAVVAAVHRALLFFRTHRDALIGPQESKP